MNKRTLGMFGMAVLAVAAVFAVVAGLRAFSRWGGPGRAPAAVMEFTVRLNRAVRAAGEGFRGGGPSILVEDELSSLRAKVGALTDVADENEFLRRVADLPARQDRRTVVAGMFAYGIAGQQSLAVINKGSRDGIVPGSAIVSEAGVLVGLVHEVRERSAGVLLVGDPSLETTGRVAGTAVGGLVRVDSTGQLSLDLVGKDEQVAEGSVVLTSGLDELPPGLIIGTVRSVDADTMNIFQLIRLDAALGSVPLWRVVVLLPV